MWKSRKNVENAKEKESTGMWKNFRGFPREIKQKKLSTLPTNFSTGNVEK